MARNTSMTRDEILANPGAATAALEEAAKEVKDPLPRAPFPPDTLVTLPGGVFVGGDLVRKVIVRELTGEHEDALAKAINNPNPYHFLDVLLRCGVERIGDLDEKETIKLLPELLVGDRDEIVLGIRTATYGEVVEVFRVLCTSCGKTIDKVEFSLTEDVERTRLADPANESAFEVELRRGARAKVRLATGAIQTKTWELADLTSPQRNDIMLSLCVETYTDRQGQTHLIAGFPSLVRQMAAPDRQAILRELSTRQPGPRYNEISFNHDECGEEVTLALGITDLFRDLIASLV